MQDIKSGLYDTYHLNFASSLSRPLMEELAKAALESDAVSQISKVFDQYLNFVSLEDNLFHLNQQNSYMEFHDPTLSDSKGDENVERTSEALFSAIVTLVRIDSCFIKSTCSR
jgi:sec1 family domain-containing protein 1